MLSRSRRSTPSTTRTRALLTGFLATTATAALALTGGTASAMTQSAAALHTAPATSAAAALKHQVHLPGGDVVTVSGAVGVTAGGRITAAVAAPGGKPAAYLGVALNGQSYVIPTDQIGAAREHLADFDVSRLAGPTHAGGGPQHISPNFVQRTLTVHAIDADGKPDNGEAIVVIANVDNFRKFSTLVFFDNGIAKVSVPLGHYTAFGFFSDFQTNAVRAVMLPQFTVAGNSSVTIDARKATTPVTVSTPKPATTFTSSIELVRIDRADDTNSFNFGGSGDTKYYVEPVTSAPSVGSLDYEAYWRMFGPGTTPAYSYDLDYPSVGSIPAQQHYVATPASLASIPSTYTAGRPDQDTLDATFAAAPFDSFLFASDLERTIPTSLTEYYSASPAVTWQRSIITDFEPKTFDLLGEWDSAWRVLQPLAYPPTRWGNGQVLTPRLLQQPLLPGTTICPACVSSSGALNVLVFPFGDSDPTHIGYTDAPEKGLTEHQSWSISADHAVLKKGTGFLQTRVAVPAGAKSVSMSLGTMRSSAAFTRSTKIRTVWSLRTAAPRGALPSGWYCSLVSPSRSCSVLPLMTDSYQLPTDNLGRLAPGATTGVLQLSHLAGSEAVGIPSVSVQVSYNGGSSWTSVTVRSRGNGAYGLSFAVPAASATNGFGELRLTAADALGGTLSQTVAQAFAVK